MEGSNRIASTIVVHVTGIDPNQWEIIHSTHQYAPSKVLIIRYLQHHTLLDILPRTIRVYGYMPNSSPYEASPLSTIKLFFSMEMTVTFITAHLVI